MARLLHSSFQKHDRIVRPNEHLLFEALPGEVLEIHKCTANGMKLVQSISCQELSVSNELIENMLHWIS